MMQNQYKKNAKEIGYIQVFHLLQIFTGQKCMSWKTKCCLSIYQKLPPLRKPELTKILPKIDPQKSLIIIKKLRASTCGPINKWWWQLTGGVVNAYASHIYCKIIRDHHKNTTEL